MRKARNQSEAILEIPFRVESIAQIAAPEGSDGVWHEYVLSQGSNCISGLRAGTRAEVSRSLDEMVDGLNDRRGQQLSKLKG